MASRGIRWLWRIARVFKWTLLGLALVVGLLLGLLHTDWGRDFVRGKITSIASEALPGSLEIEGLEGSVLGEPTLDGIVLRSPDKAEVLRIERLVVGLGLRDLLSRSVQINRLDIEGLHLNLVQAPDGSLNLLESLIDPNDVNENPWPVHLESMHLSKSSMDFTDAAGTRTQIKNLSVANLEVHTSATSTKIAIDKLQLDLPMCTGQRLSLTGDVEISEAGIASPALRVEVGESSIDLHDVHMANDMSVVSATLDAELRPELLRCLQPEVPWVGPIAFHASASKETADETIAFAFALADKKLRIAEGSISTDFSKVSAKLSLLDFRPGNYLQLGTEVQATGDFVIEVDQKAKGGLVAQFVGDGKAKVDRFAFDLSELKLKNQGKLATIQVGLRGYQGSAKVSTEVDWGQEPMVLSKGGFQASIPNLSALPVVVPLAGGLSISDTTFEGPITNLRVSGAIDGTGLRHDQTRVQELHTRFDFRSLPASFAGDVELRASGVRQGSEYIGTARGSVHSDAEGKVFQVKLQAGQPKRLSAYLDAQVVSEFGKSVVSLRALRLQHRTLRATLRAHRAKPATLTLWQGGNLTIADLHLDLGDGSLAIAGSLDKGLRATLKGISLTPLLALAPDFQMPLTATLGGEAKARMGKQGLIASVSLTSEDFQLSPESPKLRVTLGGKMEPNLVAASLKIESDARGSVTLDASVRPPRGPWTAAITRRLRSAQLQFASFDLRLLRPLHPELASLGGVLDGSIKLGAGISRVEGELKASKLVHARWTSKRSLLLTMDANQQKAEVGLALADSKIGAARLSLQLRPPGPLHSPWLWTPTLDGVFRDSDLVIESIDLVALKQAFPELDSEGLLKSGTLRGSLAVRNSGKQLKLNLEANRIRVADMPSVNASVETTLSSNSTHLEWRVTVDSNNELRGDATLAAGLGLLRDRKDLGRLLARVQEAKLDARASVITDSPSLWSKLAGSENRLPLSGQVRANATFAGSIAKPAGKAMLSIADAKVDGIGISQVTINAGLKGNEATANLTVAQTKNRKLEAEVVVDVEKRKLRRGAINAQDIDLRLLRALDKTGEGILGSVAGVANGKFEITGRWDALEPAGSLRIRDGAIDLGGSLLPIVGLSLVISAKDGLFKLEGKAQSGSGRIQISGQSKVAARGLEDISIRVRTTKVPIVVASLVCSVDIDTHSQLVIKPGLVDIKTKIDSALVQVPIRSFLAETRSLHSLEGKSDVVYVSPTPKKQDLDIDQSAGLIRLRIVADKNVQIRTKVGQARLSLNLDTTFVDNKVFINGSAEVASGHVDLFERRYVIEQASANFRGLVPINPSFDLRLRHDFDQLSLSILGRGAVDDPKITFVADPPDYDQATLLAIVLGQAPAQNENQQGLRDNALSALSTYAANKVQELLAPILPFDLDVVRVENTDNDGYLYVGGKWITDDWFVAYHYRTLADELENTNEAESKYRLSKSWSLEGVAGESEAGLDILWTKRWGK